MFIVMNLLLLYFLSYMYLWTHLLPFIINACLEDAREESSCIYKEELAVEYYYNDLFGMCQ